MAHSDFADLTVDDLQSYYSDFHKDFHGWRPRGATPEQWRQPAKKRIRDSIRTVSFRPVIYKVISNPVPTRVG